MLNSNLIKYDGSITSGSIAGGSYFNDKLQKGLYYHVISGKEVTGIPKGSYYYGVLLSFITHNPPFDWRNCQIYIPHNGNDIYIRTLNDENLQWRKISATIVSST